MTDYDAAIDYDAPIDYDGLTDSIPPQSTGGGSFHFTSGAWRDFRMEQQFEEKKRHKSKRRNEEWFVVIE